jgi:hypothetical protein
MIGNDKVANVYRVEGSEIETDVHVLLE